MRGMILYTYVPHGIIALFYSYKISDTFLYVECKLTKADGTSAPDSDASKLVGVVSRHLNAYISNVYVWHSRSTTWSTHCSGKCN